jgi:hypothetical protein
MHGAFWVVVAGFLLLVIAAALRLPKRAAVALGFAAVVGLLSTTIRLRHDVGALEDPLNGGRYYVIPLGMVAITIVVALGRALRDRVVTQPRSWAGAAIIVPGLAAGLLLQGTVLDARLPRRPDVQWDASVQCIESHHTCTIPLDPTGFSMTLPPI